MLTIGLTGGIGSGKSTVARYLGDLGALVWDADKIGHALYEPGAEAYGDLISTFGREILDPAGLVDRKKLGAIVFSDPAALVRLNKIMHPRMFERMRAMVARVRADGERRSIVIEAAILIEANWQPLFDQIWLVVASREHVLERLARDRAMDRNRVEARIRAQLPDAERRMHATAVIENDGSLEDLLARTAALWRETVARGAGAD